jgi:hypothetical protein
MSASIGAKLRVFLDFHKQGADQALAIGGLFGEVGTAWLTGLFDPATGATTYIVRITAAELISALTRRERAGTLAPSGATPARAQFRTDLAREFQVTEVTAALIAQPIALAEVHARRGYDAVQLAAALDVNARRTSRGLPPLTFVSADTELNACRHRRGSGRRGPEPASVSFRTARRDPGRRAPAGDRVAGSRSAPPRVPRGRGRGGRPGGGRRSGSLPRDRSRRG